jgi:hypothetical protein
MPIQITTEWWQSTHPELGTRWFRSNTLAILWLIAPQSIDPAAPYWTTEKDPSGGAPGSS